MSIKDYLSDFLDSTGRELGYSESDAPELDSIPNIIRERIYVWEYHGLTKEQYYGNIDLSITEVCKTVRMVLKAFKYDNPDEMIEQMSVEQIMGLYVKIVKITLKLEKK